MVALKDLEPAQHMGNVHAAACEQPEAPSELEAGSVRQTADFEEIYAQWLHDVCRWARAFGGLDADLDDLAQEVFLVVRRRLPEFDGRNVPGWLYRITQRTVAGYRRRSWYRRLLQPRGPFLEQIVDQSPGPAQEVQRREKIRRVAEILDRLSPARRSVFVLCEIEGYSGEEVAELEGIAVNTVYSRLHYARKDFCKHVAKLRESEGEP